MRGLFQYQQELSTSRYTDYGISQPSLEGFSKAVSPKTTNLPIRQTNKLINKHTKRPSKTLLLTVSQVELLQSFSACLLKGRRIK